jgi:2-keto-4-pentenoate hydratase/2-oxohepta-3-ene-1,7-dioic acid hydratase in catechol pathway
LINDKEVARISPGDMRFTVDRDVSHLSECTTLRIGDLIYLGAPAEFDVVAGDNYKVVVAGTTLLNFDIK